MLGFGLTVILLPVRMGLEAMGTDTIGTVLSMFAVGLLLGGLYSRKLIMRAGHIRLFATCGALAAVSILVCGLVVDPWVWGAMRILMGFCIACANAAIDSWLSESASQENRAQVLSANQIVIMSATFLGQFLLNTGSPLEETLFILSGILLAIGIVPIVMSRTAGPVVSDVEAFSIAKVFRISPLGTVTCGCSGVLYWGFMAMLPTYAEAHGIVDFDLTLFSGSAIAGAFIFQYPVSFLADRIDRRRIVLGMLVIGISACFTMVHMAAINHFHGMMACAAVATGMIAALYSISIAQTFDYVKQSEMSAAMGPLIATYAIGAIIGPNITSNVMQVFGRDSLFPLLAGIMAILIVFVIIRMNMREALPVEDQESFVVHGAIAGTSLEVELDPRAEYHEPEQPLSPEAEVAVNLAQSDPEQALQVASTLVSEHPEQAPQIAAALAATDDVASVDVYEQLTEAVPEMQLDIAEAVAQAQPEQASELVSQHLTPEEDTETLANIAITVSQAAPEYSADILQSAAQALIEEDPDSLHLLAEGYASSVSEQLEQMRPADRADDESEQQVAEMYERLIDIAPEQASDLAITVTEALPTVATEVTEVLVNSLSDDDGEQDKQSLEALAQHVSSVSEALPEQAQEVAEWVAEAVPEVAPEIQDIIQADANDTKKPNA